jgi:hypothetical protein
MGGITEEDSATLLGGVMIGEAAGLGNCANRIVLVIFLE